LFRPTKRTVSDEGKQFKPQTVVTFYLHGQLETGKVVKQLQNAAIVEIKETTNNDEVIFQTQGNTVVSYQDLHKKS